MASGPIYSGGIDPKTECILAKVPMSGNFKDMYLATSAGAYYSWVKGKQVCIETDFSYQRTEAVIRYPANAEYLFNQGVNYCCFTNKDYNGKHFYAFIDNIEYRNPNVSWLHITIDPISTFIYDVDMGTQFVERMHTPTDELYEWLDADVNYEGEPFINKIQHVTTNNGVDTNEVSIVNMYSSFSDVGKYISGFSTIDDIPMQGNVHIANTSGDQAEFYREIAVQNGLVAALDLGDKGLEIESFAVPQFLSKGHSGYITGSTYSVRDSFNADPDSGGSSFTTGAGGTPYVPKNWKLYNYPYSRLRIASSDGSFRDYAFELFSNGATSPKEFLLFGTIATGEAIIAPYSYCSFNISDPRNVDMSSAMPFPNAPIVSLSGSNAIVSAISSLKGETENTVSSYRNIDERGYNIGFNSIEKEDLSQTPYNSYRELGNAESLSIAYRRGEKTTFNPISETIKGALSSRSPVRTPNGKGLAAKNYGAFGISKQVVRVDGKIAKKIDMYFSLYGYSINEFMPIDLFGTRRSVFNYYKLVECNINGGIPDTYKKMIETIFNSGVRFWYSDSNFCDYSEATLAANSLH